MASEDSVECIPEDNLLYEGVPEAEATTAFKVKVPPVNSSLPKRKKQRIEICYEEEPSDSSEDEDDLQLTKKKGKKLRAKPLKLDTKKEETMADFFKTRPCFYDKSSDDYRNATLRNEYMEELAALVDLPTSQIKCWFTSMRDRYVKAVDTRSGKESTKSSSRNAWIIKNFGFLKDHIKRHPTREKVQMSTQERREDNTGSRAAVSVTPKRGTPVVKRRHSRQRSTRDAAGTVDNEINEWQSDMSATEMSTQERREDNIGSRVAVTVTPKQGTPVLKHRHSRQLSTRDAAGTVDNEINEWRSDMSATVRDATKNMEQIREHIGKNNLKTKVQRQASHLLAFIYDSVEDLSQQDWISYSRKLLNAHFEFFSNIEARQVTHTFVQQGSMPCPIVPQMPASLTNVQEGKQPPAVLKQQKKQCSSLATPKQSGQCNKKHSSTPCLLSSSPHSANDTQEDTLSS